MKIERCATCGEDLAYDGQYGVDRFSPGASRVAVVKARPEQFVLHVHKPANSSAIALIGKEWAASDGPPALASAPKGGA